MKIFVLVVGFLAAVCHALCTPVATGIEVQGSTWEKGIAEVTLRSRYPVQSSGVTGETIVKGRCEALIQKVSTPSGKIADIMRNSSGTVVGFNLRPATQVNQIYVVVKGNADDLHVFQNLSLFAIAQLSALQKGFTNEDRDYFFLTDVTDFGVTVEYRGPKTLHPAIRPFEFKMDVTPDGQLQLRQDSIRPL
jgi:hypothetical protein